MDTHASGSATAATAEIACVLHSSLPPLSRKAARFVTARVRHLKHVACTESSEAAEDGSTSRVKFVSRFAVEQRD